MTPLPGTPVPTAHPDHQPIVPTAAGIPPRCTCGHVGGDGITAPLLADHLKQHDPSYGTARPPTQFSSGRRDKLIGDPEPWRCFDWQWVTNLPSGPCRSARRNRHNGQYDPRPEFDWPLTNPANPLLAVYRHVEREHSPRIAREFVENLDKGLVPFGAQDATAGHKVHARRVLNRLASLAKESA